MTFGLVMALICLVAVNVGLAADRPTAVGWMTCAAPALLPLCYAPIGAASLILIEGVSSGLFWLGVLLWAALVARAPA